MFIITGKPTLASLIITHSTDEYLEGAFEFNAVNDLNPDITFSVTNGSFKIKKHSSF